VRIGAVRTGVGVNTIVVTARSQLRKVLFLALSVTFCLRMKYLGEPLTPRLYDWSVSSEHLGFYF